MHRCWPLVIEASPSSTVLRAGNAHVCVCVCVRGREVRTGVGLVVGWISVEFGSEGHRGRWSVTEVELKGPSGQTEHSRVKPQPADS